MYLEDCVFCFKVIQNSKNKHTVLKQKALKKISPKPLLNLKQKLNNYLPKKYPKVNPSWLPLCVNPEIFAKLVKPKL